MYKGSAMLNKKVVMRIIFKICTTKVIRKYKEVLNMVPFVLGKCFELKFEKTLK